MNLILTFLFIPSVLGKQRKQLIFSLLGVLCLVFFNMPDVQAQEQTKAPRIISLYFKDANGELIDAVKTSQVVYMYFHTENMIGEYVNIDTRDEEILYEYGGEPLVGQVVENILVVDDVMKVEFKVIGRITRLTDRYWDRIKKSWWECLWHKKNREYNKNIKRLRNNYVPMVF